MPPNSVSLHHPVNAPVVEYLRQGLTPAERDWPRFRVAFRPGDTVPIGELNTHPDLGLRLRELAPPGASQWGVVAGRFVLRSEHGVLYAVAWGTHFLALRIGSETQCNTLLAPTPAPGLGPQWVAISPFPRDLTKDGGLSYLRDTARAAYEFAESLVQP